MFVLVIVLLSSFTDGHVNVTKAPISKSALIYVFVNYTCEGIGDILLWTVQGSSLTDPSNQEREISVTTNNISVDVWSSVLTIRALPINDGISVGCNIVGQNSTFISKGATLTVKGITSVENLQLHFNLTSSSWLTWSPPFFSSENVLISYHIYIENQHGQLLYNDITEDTSYELYNLTVCDIYTVTVIAHSGEYSSSNVTIQREYNREYYVVIILPNHEVIFNKHNSFDIQFQLNIISYPRICNSTILRIIREMSLNGSEVEHTYKNVLSPLSNMSLYYYASNIDPYLNCVFIADILDYFNNSKAKNESYFTTYHVQRLTLQYYSDNGSVVVECRFAERSTADGCHVIFREFFKGTNESINISKSSIEESTVYQYITLPVSGNFTVTAHDIVDDTIITNPSVVYPQVLEYILLLPSPTKTNISIETTKFSDSVLDMMNLLTSTSVTSMSSSLKKPDTRSPVVELEVVILIIVSLVLLVLILVVVILFIVCFCKKHQKTINEGTQLHEPTSELQSSQPTSVEDSQMKLQTFDKDQLQDDLGYCVESNIDQMSHDLVFSSNPSSARLFPNSNIFRSAGAAIDFDLTSPEADNLNFEVYDYQL